MALQVILFAKFRSVSLLHPPNLARVERPALPPSLVRVPNHVEVVLQVHGKLLPPALELPPTGLRRKKVYEHLAQQMRVVRGKRQHFRLRLLAQYTLANTHMARGQVSDPIHVKYCAGRQSAGNSNSRVPLTCAVALHSRTTAAV